MPRELPVTTEDRRIAALAALAIAVHVLESGIPSPVPGIKPGLANIVTLLVLFRHGWRTAAWVSLLRVLAGSLLLGTFMSPTFFLSLAGAAASLLAIGLLWQLPRGWFGLAGFSVLAAVSHVTAQLLVAWWLFVPHQAVLRLLPLLVAAGIVFGVINAIITSSIDRRLQQTA